jgi:sn-glycerol 3-phosphate transport system substrate-binding protein
VAPLPDLRPGGGVQTAEGSLWIVSRSAPEKQAAAWQYIKFLDSESELVDLHLRTGYVPIRKSVAESPEIQALWKKSPEYAVSYEQLVAGPTNAATTGPVIGAFPEVREAVKDGYVSMFVGGKTAEQALKETQARADAAIKDYNDRVGG